MIQHYVLKIVDDFMTGRWFSSTNKTNHDITITIIFLKVALNTTTISPKRHALTKSYILYTCNIKFYFDICFSYMN